MSFKVGDQLECVNSEGWKSFAEGGTYEVTKLYHDDLKELIGIDLDEVPVWEGFFSDFKLVSVTKEKSEKTPAPKTAKRLYAIFNSKGRVISYTGTREDARQVKAKAGGKAKGYTIVVYTPTEEIR